MNMLKKYAYLLMMVAVAFGFAACSEDEYQPAQPAAEDCQQVYFVASNVSELELASNEIPTTTVNVKVARVYGTDAASIPVKVIATDDIFNVPETIEFAEGAATTTLPITFNEGQPEGARQLTITFEGDEYLDPYTQLNGHVYYTLDLNVESWVNLGMGQITDDFMTGLFGAPSVTWEVEMWTRSSMPGYLCIKNAYTSTYPYNEPGDYQEETHWWYINIADPNAVVMETQYMGFDWGYGEFFFGQLKNGTLVNGVITWPVKGLAIGMPEMTGTALGYYGNQSGLFKIVMPK
ncbi:MAG: hypothetical protein IKU77_01670 [Alistipes sp.]|nr:hypothetical protein [Alistipes sp.]